MKTDLIYFDYGNVICTDSDPHFFNYVSSKIKKPVEVVREVFSQKFSPFVSGTISDEDFFKFLAKNLDTNPQDVSSWFSTVYPPHLKPKQEILEVAYKVRRKGIQAGILSNIASPLMQICLDNGYYEGFSPLILSAAVKLCKPQSEIYQLALIIAGINVRDANSVVFIDDKEKYLEPAKELGFRTVHFNNNHETASDLERKLIAVGVEI